MKKHVELLAILHIVYHALGLVGALCVLIFVGGAGLISGNEIAIAVTAIVAIVISSLIFIFSIPGVIGGIGLLKMREWGRILTLVMGFLSLMAVPFGTALGIYTIWVLMKDETIKLFEGQTRTETLE